MAKDDNIGTVAKLYPNATHPDCMDYTQQCVLDGILKQSGDVQVKSSVVSNVEKNSDYIQSLYPNATHPSRMVYVQQDAIGDIAVSTVSSEGKAVVSDSYAVGVELPIVGDSDYIQSLYPNATHPSRMVYAQQDAIGDIVVSTVSSEGKTVVSDSYAVGVELPIVGDSDYIQSLYPNATYPSRMVYAQQDAIGAMVPSVVGTKDECSTMFTPETAKIKISANTTALPTQNIATGFVAGTIVAGIGGGSPLAESVLYAGSKVARDAMGVIDSVYSTSTIQENLVSTNTTGSTYTGVNVTPYGGAINSTVPYGSATDNDSDDSVDGSYDVLIVGGGPSGLATAIRLKQMATENGKDISVCLIEKGGDIGSHIMSGAVLETRALDELIPDWKKLGAPLDTPALTDDFLFLTQKYSIKMPTPPQMHNKGNYIISLGKFCKWLGDIAEEMGVEVYTGTSASEVLQKNGKVVGVRTGAFGIDKNGEKTPNYTEGMELLATYTVMGEGCRGHLTKGLFEDFDLRKDADPQTFGIGIKELWEVPAEQSTPGKIVHTTGWPMDSETYGGSFLYHLSDNQVAVGFVIGLDYKNPNLFPYMEFQRFKHHPSIAKHLTGGRRVSYGARAINEGGYQSIPSLVFDGGMLVGCTAGFLNVPKIKGTHTAMKSGMIAGEEIYKALQMKTVPAKLDSYPTALEQSWVYEELYKVRNIRPSFHKFKFWGV